jgi:hypothetical protein
MFHKNLISRDLKHTYQHFLLHNQTWHSIIFFCTIKLDTPSFPFALFSYIVSLHPSTSSNRNTQKQLLKTTWQLLETRSEISLSTSPSTPSTIHNLTLWKDFWYSSPNPGLSFVSFLLAQLTYFHSKIHKIIRSIKCSYIG